MGEATTPTNSTNIWSTRTRSFLSDIEDSSHIPTEQYIQWLGKEVLTVEMIHRKDQLIVQAQQIYTVIPSEPITELEPVQTLQVFQRQWNKKMTLPILDYANVRYNQTMEQLFKTKPTPSL